MSLPKTKKKQKQNKTKNELGSNGRHAEMHRY